MSFDRWFKGDQNAVHFANAVYQACQMWDDIEDEGKCENHNAMIAWWAFDKEYDPYFAAHAPILRPALLSMYLQWRASNVLDRGSRDDVAKSYMLRAGVYHVWHLMAWIAGGDNWAAEIGPEIYRAYSETPDQIWSEFNA